MNSMISTQQLRQPISAEFPCGQDPRQGTLQADYFKAKDTRRSARDIERTNITAIEQRNPLSLWQSLNRQCQLLLTHSKDLEIACWLTEALLREYHFAGLTQGFELIKQLIAQYHSELFPAADEDGILTTLRPLAYLNGESRAGTLIIAIASIPMTQSQSDDNFTQWAYLQALNAKDSVQLASINRSLSNTPDRYLQRLYDSLVQAITEFSQLCHVVEATFKPHSPPSSHIKNALNDYKDCLLQLANAKINTHHSTASSLTNIQPLPASAAAPTLIDNDHLDRATALQTLEQIAVFFSKNEPHSPVPYLLRRAIKWSHMDLAKLLEEIVDDQQLRRDICHLTGISGE